MESILVCFAVKEEAAAFKRRLDSSGRVRVLVTGMGGRNAERSIRDELRRRKPDLVFTCGFAGGLNPRLRADEILFSTDDSALRQKMEATGAKPARFHFAKKVVSTADKKKLLWESTQADAVEMESQIICAVCKSAGVRSATVRVILDAATEDLPLDFNQFMTPDDRMDYGKLAFALLKSPGKIHELTRFRKRVTAASESLAAILQKLIFE